MIIKIRNRVEKELVNLTRALNKKYGLHRISPVLFSNIKEFVLRPGKRIRPTLLAISYLGFAKKTAPGLYTTAVSLELLHDFMLVHDDIIDKSDTRRGAPSMHRMLNRYLKDYKGLKFNGQDLAIVIGDVMYAAAIHAFLSIKAEWKNKEDALKKFIEAAMYTGSGEFIELIEGIKSIDNTSREDIFRVYDLKTAYYTFAAPLYSGAVLAAAEKRQADILFQYGIQIGRAFQIKDDIIGIFGKETDIGKPNLTDLKEAKKTLLVWHGYHHSPKANKKAIKNILAKTDTDKNDLLKIRQILNDSGALNRTINEIKHCLAKADTLLNASKIKPLYKKCLYDYSQQILKI